MRSPSLAAARAAEVLAASHRETPADMERRMEELRGGSEWTREAECDGEEEGGRTEAIGRMAREELEAGLGRGRYAVGAEWDEGSMVHAMRRFGGRTIEWRFGDG